MAQLQVGGYLFDICEIFPKIDIQYVKSMLAHVDMNAAIIFICTNENWRKEDGWKYKGKQYYTIRLPYQQVKETDDVRPLMLELAAKRLGSVVPGETVAASG